MQVKRLIFDFDGTIADSFETAMVVFGEIFPKKKKLTQQEVKSLRGSSLKEILKYLKIRKWQVPRLVFQAKRRLAGKMTKIKIFKGLPEVLKNLDQEGYEMFILSTNSPNNIDKFLRAHGLEAYFQKIYGDIGLRGKAPALKKLMKKERIRAADVIYFGDEARDVEAAKKVGVTCVAVGWGYNYPQALKQAGPDHLAETPEKLLKIISETAQ